MGEGGGSGGKEPAVDVGGTTDAGGTVESTAAAGTCGDAPAAMGEAGADMGDARSGAVGLDDATGCGTTAGGD